MVIEDGGQPEVVPAPSLEEWTLGAFGYADRLDTVLPATTIGPETKGRNFLDAYGASPHRQDTEDLLTEFRSMDPEEPDYEPLKRYIERFLKAKFGDPLSPDEDGLSK